MSDVRNVDWDAIVDALHGLSNVMTVHTHYPSGHPAIEKAANVASQSMAKGLERLPEIVIALLEGELLVCERPMPELRTRLVLLTDAMARHGLECFVFQRGLLPAECGTLGHLLASTPADDPLRARDQAQAALAHVLLRWAEIRSSNDAKKPLARARYFVPLVRELIDSVCEAIVAGAPIERARVERVAEHILEACMTRTFRIEQRCIDDKEDEAAHATNVAVVTAALAIEAGHPDDTCKSITCAALLHDIGHVLLPANIRGIPEPLLDEPSKAIFRNHTFAGARALLLSGCPSLWIAVALEHHRGVDGAGYPTLSTQDAPHDLVRLVALANYYDRKRTLLQQTVDEADAVVSSAWGLERKYFGEHELRAFARALGTFPPGTTVELSDRRAAVVTQANPSDPMRPHVEILTGADAGKRFDLKTLDATEDRHVLSIARAIAPPLAIREASIEAPVDIPMPKGPAIAPASVPPVALEAPKPRLSGLYSSIPREEPTEDMPPIPSAPPPRITAPPSKAPSAPPPKISIPPKSAPPPRMAPVIREKLDLDAVPSLAISPKELSSLALDHRAGFVLSMIDGMSSLENIIDASGMSEDDVLGIVSDLVTRNVIRLG